MAKKKRGTGACPCSSGAPYVACCRPFHGGEEPDHPVRLMRSRFSAFALGEGEYLVRTLHPEHASLRGARQDLVRELSQAKRTLRYQRLEVHDHAIDGDRAQVLFTAHVFERGQDRSFVELSFFERVGGGWRYLDGVTRAAGAPVESIERFERALEDAPA